MNKRPKASETDEDLINLEKTFKTQLGSNKSFKPAASVIKSSSYKPQDASIINSISEEQESNSPQPSSDDTTLKEIPLGICFTGRILEKNLTEKNYSINPCKNISKTSIFKKERGVHDIDSNNHKDKSQQNSAKSPANDGAKGGNKIGDLDSYSEAKLLEAQQSLLKNIKPETLKYLEQRRNEKLLQNNELRSEVKDSEILNEKESQFTLPLTLEETKNIPHMDQVEHEKLQWTAPVSLVNPQNSNDFQNRSARFTLKGELVTKDMEADLDSWDRGLHHHGEEMERAGYTMEELFIYSRSLNPQQRTLGLNTLSHIFNRAHLGEFDLVMDRSVFQVCNEMDFIHVLRVSLDYSDSLSLNASLNSISALIYPAEEEYFLDFCYLWPNSSPHPSLVTGVEKIPKSATTSVPPNKDDMSERDLKDFQFIESDLLDFLILRTDIITRINYVFTSLTHLLTESGVQGALKILIRISRHSPHKLTQSSSLLNFIFNNYVSSNLYKLDEKARQPNMIGTPLFLAMKLFRVLADSSIKNSELLYQNYDLIKQVMTYLAYEEWMTQNIVTEASQLVLESYKIWNTFLANDIGVQEFLSFFPVIMKYLQLLYRSDTLSSFDFNCSEHLFSAFLTLLKSRSTPQINLKLSSSRWEAVKEYSSFVSSIILKLLSWISGHILTPQNQDLALLVISAGMRFIQEAKKYDNFPTVDKALLSFVSSPSYAKITSSLIPKSLLLFDEKDSDPSKEALKYPQNIVNSSVILHGAYRTPILNIGSPHAFLTSLFSYFKNNEELKSSPLINSNILKYVTKLESTPLKKRLNSFLKYELHLINEILNFLPDEKRAALAFKILPHAQNGDKKLIKSLLVAFLKVISEKGSNFSMPYEERCNFYTRYLALTENPIVRPDKCSFKNLNKKYLPNFWIIEPITVIYQKFTKAELESKGRDLQTRFVEIILKDVTICLEIFSFCLSNYNSLVISSPENIGAYYTRIVLCFMMGEDLFMNAHVKELLNTISTELQNCKFLKNAQEALFTNYSEKEGFVSTFNTLYTELLTEFSSNSFGDEIFSTYLLLPIRPHEDKSIKSLFWSDECIRFFRLNAQNDFIALDYFISEKESDEEVLDLYRNALNSKRVTKERNPFLFLILTTMLDQKTIST